MHITCIEDVVQSWASEVTVISAMLKWWEEEYEIQLMLAHFEWIADDGAEKMVGNNKESYSSLDENEQEKWQW